MVAPRLPDDMLSANGARQRKYRENPENATCRGMLATIAAARAALARLREQVLA